MDARRVEMAIAREQIVVELGQVVGIGAGQME
jgi:hypothetical protein